MSVKLPLSEPFLRAKEAAHYIGISFHTLEKHRRRGTGPQYSQVGRRIVYGVADLRAWVSRSRRATAGSAITIIPPAKTTDTGIEPAAGGMPVILGTPEAARLLRMSPRTLAKHRADGDGPAYSRISGRVFYALGDLIAFANRGAMLMAAPERRPAVRRAAPARKRAARSAGGSR